MNQRPRIILSAGGTGGHLFPAQSVANKLSSEMDILFVAGGLRTSSFFNRDCFAYHEVPVATWDLKHPWYILKNTAKMSQGVLHAIKILRQFRPNLVIGFGSFYSFPVLMAAHILRIPILLHEQNVWPGRVNRLFSRFGYPTAITFEDTKLMGPTQLVHFSHRTHPYYDPYEYFGWPKGEKGILICGGSQGAYALNEFMIRYPWQEQRLIHIVGQKPGEVERIAAIYQQKGVRAQVKAFEPRMDLAMQVAEFAICRSGAATISELITFCTPAICVPFPYAKDDHQWKNADFFSRVIGGGAVIREASLDEKTLQLAISQLDVSVCRQRLEMYKHSRQAQDFDVFASHVLSTGTSRRRPAKHSV